MRKIIALAIKDVFLRFSSRSELLFFLILPIIFTFALSGGFGAGPGSSGNGLPMLVVNEDQTPLAQEFITTLDASTAVAVTITSAEEAAESFNDGDVLVYVIIPAGFSASVQAGQTTELTVWQVPNNSDAIAMAQLVQTAVSQVSQALTAATFSTGQAEKIKPFATDADRQAYFQDALSQARTALADQPNRLTVTQPATAVAEEDDNTLQAHQSAGQMVTWVLIPLLGTSALLAGERSRGTLRRLLTTPTSKAIFLLGTITGQLGLAMVQMLLLIGFGVWGMGLNWGSSFVGLLLMMLSFGLAAVALGTMLGTFVKTDSQASNLSIMLGMSMALLGGCWWPLELFPNTVRTAVTILPTKWAMQGFSDLVVRGLGVGDVLPETAVLFAFSALFFIVGVSRFRFE